MRVALLNPDSRLRQDSSQLRRFVAPVPPLGLAMLGAVLEADGFEVTLLDQVASEVDNAALLDRLRRERPGLVGISCLTPVMGNVAALVAGLRRDLPGVPVVMGNTHATVFARELLSQGLCDAVVHGEGEPGLLELARAVRDGRPLAGAAGVDCAGADGQVIAGPPRPPLPDLDALPRPAWHLLDLSLYEKVPMLCLPDGPTLSIQASRGCYYRCTFCSQDQLFKKFRHRSVGSVVDEMAYFLAHRGVRRFVFIDANFPFTRDFGFAFCAELRRRGLHRELQWLTETRPDMVDRELLGAMKAAGLHLIMYGFEVGNQAILDSLDKGFTLAQAREAMRLTREAGIYTLGLFMLGMPGETVQTCRQTIALAKELDCDMVKFNIAVPLPGSRFYEEQRHRLRVDAPERFTSWTDWSPEAGKLVWVPEGMTDAQLRVLQRQAMLAFYARPRLVARHLRNGTLSPRNMILGGGALLAGAVRTALTPRRR